MAGTAGDVIQVGVEMSLSGVVLRNVFYYMLDDVPSATYLVGLLTEFQTVVLTPLAASQITTVVINNVSALNIFSGDVLEDNTPTPAAGTRAGAQNQPIFNAGMILLTRQNNRVRHGRKFIPIALQADVSGNAFAAGFLTLMNNIAAVCDNILNAGGVDFFSPVIVGRVPYTTAAGKQAYRLPTSQAEMSNNWSVIGECRVINRVTTMNSRKFWRGE